jgi:hypothetical protein
VRRVKDIKEKWDIGIETRQTEREKREYVRNDEGCL